MTSQGQETPETNPTQTNAAETGPIRLSLAVAAPGVTARDLERFLASRAAAGVGVLDEVLIAASPAAAADANELAEWIEAQSPLPSPDAQARNSAPSLRASGFTALAPSSNSALSVTLHPAGTTPMRLWGFAMSRARGHHVAVLDARDTLSEGWVPAWAEAMARCEGAIVCGPVDPGNLKDSCSWAAYLSEYGRFWTPLSPDDLDEAPGNNIVFPRATLPTASALQSDGFWKTFHLQSLRRASGSSTPGHAEPHLAVSPAMIVRVQRHYRLAHYLRRKYLHGRCYGGRRLNQPGAPPRILCLGFTPLLPWVRTARVLARLASRSRGEPTLRQPRAWPRAALGPLVLGEIAWSWGEFAGYARGSGTACEELS